MMLIHQIPPKPNYLRVKVARRLSRIGAVALKNTVYVLPSNDTAQEDFQWVLREILACGGEATLLDAHLIEGLTDTDIEMLFRSARDADYRAVAEEAHAVDQRAQAVNIDDEARRQIEAEVLRLERRLEEIGAIDFFDAPGRLPVVSLVAALRARVTPPPAPQAPAGGEARHACAGRTWVTRAGIHVDRIASAWLVRRFVDPEARFKFVPAKGYTPEPGEIRFDMYEAEFSHEGDCCSFEVLRQRLEIDEAGLQPIAEIVHDIDLKDGKFGRPEVGGVAALLTGLALAHRDDETRLSVGCELFDALRAYFARKRS